MKRAHIERLIDDLLETRPEDCFPSGGGGSDMHWSPNVLVTTHDFENGVEFSEISSPSRGCHRGSLCSKFGQEIEMTLLPGSSIRSTQCTRSSGLGLKELFEPGSASESFNDGPGGAFECRTSLDEFKRPAPPTEVEVEASDCYTQKELAEPAFQHLDRATVFPYEPVYQAALEDIDSSPVTSACVSDDEKCQSVEAGDEVDDKPTCMECFASSASGEMLNAEESHTRVEIISNQNDDSILLKNLPELCQEANQMQSESLSESDDDKHAAKRRRIATPSPEPHGGEELTSDLSTKDLNYS